MASTYAKILRCCLLIVLTAPLLNTFAQSGKVVQTPQPTPLPKSTLPQQENAKLNSVDDGHTDKYRLVFPTSYEGTILTVGEEAADRTRHARLNNFIEQLNRAGAQGFRLLSVTSLFPIAIVKRDEGHYEYAWFETNDSSFFYKIGFAGMYERLSKQGYRVIEHLFIESSCKSFDDDNPAFGERCAIKDLYLFEREEGAAGPKRFIFANSPPGWRSKMGEELTTTINGKLAEGFYPTKVFSKYEILLEQTAKNDERYTDQPDVQVVTLSNWGGDKLEEKVNKLAKQRYRLALTNNGIAVMYRHGDTATPVTYVWLKAREKSFEKQLARMQESGAVYRMTYPDGKGHETRLIFEQKQVDDGQRLEYKVLKLKFQYVETAVDKKVNADLTPASKEMMKEFDRLVKEGFVVRDLFFSDEVCILLERTR